MNIPLRFEPHYSELSIDYINGVVIPNSNLDDLVILLHYFSQNMMESNDFSLSTRYEVILNMIEKVN